MIVRELLDKTSNGKKLYKTFSDLGYKIKQVETGIIYDSAIDIVDKQYTYVEVEPEKIEEDIKEADEYGNDIINS